ncbi:MAG: serine/threonine-protein kinase [Spirochaetota bacterium]
MAKQPPAKIGKYKVTEQIASGGMGAVYKAEHPTLSRYVIIKKLTLRGDASMRERFRREAQIMMDFTSDYIANVYDHFREGSSYYIVLEYVDGPTLETLLRKERYLPERVALRIFRSSCRALEYAHQRGVVHRDIKPGNILISKDGNVKLVDFGIASIHGAQSEENLTREGMTLGTPSYMAPEQYEDSSTVDKRADVYSMGVMLYEMTTGKKPFSNSISAEAIRRIQQGKYTAPRKHNPNISTATQRLIRRCMKNKPERRYQSMGQVLSKLDKVIDRRVRVEDRQVIGDYLAGKRTQYQPKSRARRLVVALAAVLVLALAGGAGYAYLEGYHYEYLYPDEYGALRVTVQLPTGAKAPEEVYVDAELFRDDGDEFPEVEEAQLRFSRDPERDTEDRFVMRSQKRYLPTGAYRIKVMAEQELMWQSFFLLPRDRQQQQGSTLEAREVTLDADSGRQLPLEVSLEVTNRATREPVEGPFEVSYSQDGEWEELTAELRDELQSGSVHRFRVETEGFFTEEYALRVEPYQTDLRVEAELTPYPAAVDIESNTGEIDMRIGGQERYFRGGRGGGLEPVPEIEEGRTELVLPPGEHRLTFRQNGASQTVTMRLDRLDRRTLRVSYDEENERISVDRVESRTDESLGEGES